MTDATRVLLAYGGADPTTAVPRIQAVAAGVEVIVCKYENTHDVRTLRDEQPWSPRLKEVVPPLTAEQQAAFAAADVALALDVPLDMANVAPRMRWIQHSGSGYARYRSAGLSPDTQLTNAAGISADGIGEFVLARLLEHWKRLPEIADRQNRRDWGFTFGRRAAGKHLVVVGLGAIGVQVANLARALGMRTTGVVRTRRPLEGAAPVDDVVTADALHAALPSADAVVLCATDTAANENLFDAAAFAAMPGGSFFMNVSRGRLVDDDALIAALRSGHLAAAAIDVARVEPVPADSPLWTVPNLRLSPHSSSTQEGYPDRVVDLFCDNLDRFLNGRPLRNLVTLDEAPASSG